MHASKNSIYAIWQHQPKESNLPKITMKPLMDPHETLPHNIPELKDLLVAT